MNKGNDILGDINRSGDLKDAIQFGYLIIGPNTSDGNIWRWHADSEEMAVKMASQWASDTECTYEIFKYELIGIVRPKIIPVEFIKKNHSDSSTL